VLRKNSSTSRRSRSLVIVSPTTRLAASRARSATSARTSVIARTFSASMSAAARARSRSSSSFVAAISASRVSWATFWARDRMSFDALRFGVLAIAPRLLGVLESLFDARLPVLEHARDRLEREGPDDREEQQEVGRGDDDLEQVHLEERPGPFRLGCQADDLTPDLGRDGQQVHDVFLRTWSTTRAG